jgi:glutaryl-CoA dehydrogenase
MNSYSEWLDPFFLEDFLDEDEKSIRDNTKKFVQKNLLPEVIKHNRNHTFDKEMFKEFGAMGFLGSNIKGYGSIGVNKVSYGLIAFEIESIDSSYRSAVSVQSSLVCHPIEFFGSEEQKKNIYQI